ncbi:Thyrotropin receptor [Liparis tanakae]|uniref:Thyrotropin receptor n=1 Tax=Liparis tanakae TaxID=230148 RepID=A0A4Z2EDB2_9TELE|nr:Thyrotropin receptor [Liparis tanakae]
MVTRAREQGSSLSLLSGSRGRLTAARTPVHTAVSYRENRVTVRFPCYGNLNSPRRGSNTTARSGSGGPTGNLKTTSKSTRLQPPGQPPQTQTLRGPVQTCPLPGPRSLPGGPPRAPGDLIKGSCAEPAPARVQHPSSMQVITCALFTLASLPIGAGLEAASCGPEAASCGPEAASCPADCECSEWKTLTISCFDIAALPRFPASTETL